MCDIQPITQDSPTLIHSILVPNTTSEHIVIFDEEDTITLLPDFYKANAKLFCRHPDKNNEWHEMTPNPGEALVCPAKTELKFVR